MQRDLHLALYFLALRHTSAHDRQVFIEPDSFLQALCAKGFGGGEKVDGFEPVGLTLPVVAVDNIEAVAPGNFTAQIPEIMYLKRFEQHVRDFNTSSVRL